MTRYYQAIVALGRLSEHSARRGMIFDYLRSKTCFRRPKWKDDAPQNIQLPKKWTFKELERDESVRRSQFPDLTKTAVKTRTEPPEFPGLLKTQW